MKLFPKFPLARLDRQWRYVAVNAAFLAVTCMAASAVLGQVCWNVFAGLRQTPIGRLMRHGMRSRATVTGRFPSTFWQGQDVVVVVVPNDETGGIDVSWSYLLPPDDDDAT